MGRKLKSPEDGTETEVEDPIVTETETPVVNLDPEPTALPIVNLDDEIAKESAPPEQQANGVHFWFGHVGMLKFPDKSEYHIRSNRAFITDPELLAKLNEAAKNPANKIFPQ
jgi:hypothetical protein